MSGTVRLFVYGSLMTEMEAASLLAGVGARLVGPARMKGALLDFGEYPGAIRGGRASDFVRGELYELDDESRLWVVDDYEEYQPASPSHSLFVRERAEIEVEGNGVVEAWAYFYNAEQGSPKGQAIATGDYRRHRQLALRERQAAYKPKD